MIITLEGFSPIVVQKLVELIYKGQTYVNQRQNDELLELCDLLQLEVVMRNCYKNNVQTPEGKDTFDKDCLTSTEISKSHSIPSNQDLMRQWQTCYQNLNILKKESSVVGKLEYDTQYEESNPTSAVKEEQSGYEYCAIIDELICDSSDDLSSTEPSASEANLNEQVNEDNVNMLAARSNS